MTARTLQIFRYDPDTDAKPRMQTLAVELDGSERMLLDALMMKLKGPTAATRARPSGWTTSKTRTACCAATPS